MIYIKLSVIHKAETVGLAVIFALIVVVVAMNASGNNTTPVSTTETHNDDTVVSETATTESYETETQDKSIDETTEVQEQTETTAVETEIEAETKTTAVSQPTMTIYYSEQDAFDIAKVLWNECRGVPSVTEQACVAWTILNRVDKYNSTVHDVVRAPNQFAFSEGTTLDPVLIDIAYDVLYRWNAEKNGETDVGRVLPKEYTYFEGYGGHNHFRDAYSGSYNLWDYSLPSPYGD